MPLVDLLNVPETPEQRLAWSFAHMDAHVKINNALFQKSASNVLPLYILDPMPDFKDENIKTWLALNQSSHDSFNALLGNAGSDLSAVDWSQKDQVESWVRLHFTEHLEAQLSLGYSD